MSAIFTWSTNRAHQIIVACDVTDQSNDKQQFEPMLEQARDNGGHDKSIKAASADNGYHSESNVQFAEDRQIDAYIATRRIKHNDSVPKVPRRRPPKDLTVQEKMARKLRTKKGRETYSKRKSIVEPVFGQIKRARGFEAKRKQKSTTQINYSDRLLGIMSC